MSITRLCQSSAIFLKFNNKFLTYQEKLGISPPLCQELDGLKQAGTGVL